MNPSSSLHGLNLVVYESEREANTNRESAVSSSLNTLLPTEYGNWKPALAVLVLLPIALWLLVSLLN